MKNTFLFFLIVLFTAVLHAQSFTAPFGKRKKIILPDRTQVILNSNSTLWLEKEFNKQQRRVRLEGDAYFDIVTSPKIFIVTTPHLKISTYGAAAKINAYPDVAGEETLLRSGKLKIVKSYYSKLDPDPYYLVAGDLLMMNRDIDLMEKEKFDTADLKRWVTDKIVFNNVDPKEFIKRIKESFNVEIEVRGDVSDQIRFTGVFEAADLQKILAVVGESWHFRYQAYQNNLVLKF